MSRYKVEVTKYEEYDCLEPERVYGKDAERICGLFGIEMKEEYGGKEYVTISVPSKDTTSDKVFEQTVEDLDLGQLVVLINTKKEEK